MPIYAGIGTYKGIIGYATTVLAADFSSTATSPFTTILSLSYTTKKASSVLVGFGSGNAYVDDAVNSDNVYAALRYGGVYQTIGGGAHGHGGAAPTYLKAVNLNCEVRIPATTAGAVIAMTLGLYQGPNASPTVRIPAVSDTTYGARLTIVEFG